MMKWQKLTSLLLTTTSLARLKTLRIPLVWVAMGVGALCVLLILTVAYLKKQELSHFLNPPSPDTVNTQLLEKIQAVEKIISHQFSLLSIPAQQISLQQFQHRKNLIEWNYSVITVTLPPEITLNQVTNTFKRGFPFFEIEGLTYQIFQTEANSATIEVSIQGCITHQLIFNYPPPPSQEQNTTSSMYQASLIIDDLGKSYADFKKLLELEIPFTCSILPFETYSVSIAKEAYKNNREVILHLPLEPRDAATQPINRGMLLTSMDEHQLLAHLERNLNALPHISGVSNHMGSKFTEDEEKMEILLKKIKEKGLYFLDSRTTTKTVAYQLARKMALRTAYRDLFIDNDLDPTSIEAQLAQLPRIAKKNGGYAIAIGHPHSSTIETIKKLIPLFKEWGVSIVPLSQLVK